MNYVNKHIFSFAEPTDLSMATAKSTATATSSTAASPTTTTVTMSSQQPVSVSPSASAAAATTHQPKVPPQPSAAAGQTSASPSIEGSGSVSPTGSSSGVSSASSAVSWPSRTTAAAAGQIGHQPGVAIVARNGQVAAAANLTEAEALLQLSNQESDEGIVSDQSSSADSEADAQKRLKVGEKVHFRCLHMSLLPHLPDENLSTAMIAPFVQGCSVRTLPADRPFWQF